MEEEKPDASPPSPSTPNPPLRREEERSHLLHAHTHALLPHLPIKKKYKFSYFLLPFSFLGKATEVDQVGNSKKLRASLLGPLSLIDSKEKGSSPAPLAFCKKAPQEGLVCSDAHESARTKR